MERRTFLGGIIAAITGAISWLFSPGTVVAAEDGISSNLLRRSNNLVPVKSAAPGKTVWLEETIAGVDVTVVDGQSYRYSHRGGDGWIEYTYEVPDCHGNIFEEVTFNPPLEWDDFHRQSIAQSPRYTEWWEGWTGRRWGDQF